MRLRLIDVETMQFASREQMESDQTKLNEDTLPGQSRIPVPYAVLSHRWLQYGEGGEVTFQEFRSGDIPPTKSKGLDKIRQLCRLAAADGLRYAWSDTCCIDKNSSAELQESINSMFSWYRDAAVCYAYLKDTIDVDAIEVDEWFTRGWTLQELLAPRRLVFYNRDWKLLGDKIELRDHIHRKTEIDLTILQNPDTPLTDFSVAQRLSWAAGRETEMAEDRAYSLFGIFDVNMPMLYGEGGEKAFLRLQEEISKRSDDHTIFAWQGLEYEEPGLLARSIECFKDCGDIRSTTLRKGRSAYSITNRGISISLDVFPWTIDTYLARIRDCMNISRPTDPVKNSYVGIFLRRLDSDDQYARVKVDGKEVHQVYVPPPAILDEFQRHIAVNIRQMTLRPDTQHATDRVFGFRVVGELLSYDARGKLQIRPFGELALWDAGEHILYLRPGSLNRGEVGTLDISMQKKSIHQIKVGFDFDFNPVVFVAEPLAIGFNQRKTSPFDSQEYNIDLQYSPEAREAGMPLSDRYPSSDTVWSTVATVNGKAVAAAHPIRQGLWVLKGDRINGLDVELASKKIRVKLSKEVMESGKLIWDLRVDNVFEGKKRWT